MPPTPNSVALSMAFNISPTTPPAEVRSATYFWTRTDRASPSSFPHFSHDLNSLSTHSINAAAFIAPRGIGATDPLSSLSSCEDIAQAYDAVLPNSGVDGPTALEFDHVGVLFEYADMYLVAMKDGSDHASVSVNRGFIEKQRVGTHVVAEWVSLPKETVSRCIIASGTGGWWHVRSKVLGEMREEVALTIKGLEKMRAINEWRGEDLDEERYMSRLREEVAVVVDRTYQKMEWEERKGREREEREMGEWLDWDARGEDDGQEKEGDAMQVEDTVQEANAMLAELVQEKQDVGEKQATGDSGDVMEE